MVKQICLGFQLSTVNLLYFFQLVFKMMMFKTLLYAVMFGAEFS